MWKLFKKSAYFVGKGGIIPSLVHSLGSFTFERPKSPSSIKTFLFLLSLFTQCIEHTLDDTTSHIVSGSNVVNFLLLF